MLLLPVPTATELSTISTAKGDEGEVDGSGITSITGSASAVRTQLGALTDKPSNPIAASVTGIADASDISTLLDSLSYVSSVNGSQLTRINGTATEVLAAIEDIGDTKPNAFIVGLEGAATATQISNINSSNGDEENASDIVGTGITSLTGTASALVAAIALLDNKPSESTITLDSGSTEASDITTLENYDYISTVNGSSLDEINGTTSEITTALDDLTSVSSDWDSTIDGEIVASQLKTINDATDGTISLVDANKNQELEATAAILADALVGIDGYTGAVTFSVADTEAADINTVNGLTTGDLDGSALRVVSGTASAIRSALTALDDGPSDNMTTVSISGDAEAADISYILDTFDFVTALTGTEITSINGTTAEVVAAIEDLGDSIPDDFDSAIAGTVVPSNLKTINDATTGEITLAVNNVALTDSPSNLAGAFDGITSYTANITLNANHDIDQLVTINNATSGSITTNASVDLAGTGAKVAQAVANFGADGYAGNVSLNTSATIDEINTISDLIDGTVTLNSAIGLTGTADDLAETITNLDSYEGDVTIQGNHDVQQLKTINQGTAGDITFGDNNIDLDSDDDTLAAALQGVTNYGGTVTISSEHTLENLTTINTAVSGTVVVEHLDSPLSGSATAISAALSDLEDYTGHITFSAAPAVAQKLIPSNQTPQVILTDL